MARSSRKLTATRKKAIAEQRARVNREADTIYWLQFYPKDGVTVSPEDLETLWRVLLRSNPANVPEDIEEAEKSFEFGLKVSSWKDIAESHEVIPHYMP